MKNKNPLEIWFVTGSQHLYGEETLRQVAEHSQEIAQHLNAKSIFEIVYKPTVKTPEEITSTCREASASKKCIGVIAWMHTFSPAKMWITGLNLLTKPLLHLHTQFNQDIPFADIDMDFMNLNQSAHGDREFAFMLSRMRLNRKTVVGHWKNATVIQQINDWCRVALGKHEMNHLKLVRFGDNMRQVAVTEGDKVEAQKIFGIEVNTHGVGDLVQVINQISDVEVQNLLKQYQEQYTLRPELQADGARRDSLVVAARIELGIQSFLQNGGYGAYTNTFEDLHGMRQLPGIGSQRMMAAGYGYGGEGDWKTSAMVRVMKQMATGLPGGNSFMEDYTYHFNPQKPMVLGSHMLEICPSICTGNVSCEVHPLGIGGKEDPVRLVFNADAGDAINVSLVDMGGRFRLIINEVTAHEVHVDFPKLPTARALWTPKPNMEVGCQAWLLAGGAHHTVYSQNLSTQQMEDFADMFGIEVLVIDADTRIRSFKKELAIGEVVYR